MSKVPEMWLTVVRPRFQRGMWWDGEMMTADNGDNERRRDFARRRRLYEKEERGAKSGETGMGS
jgi:hypothetical protein